MGLVIMSRVYKIDEFINCYMLCVGIPLEREGGLSQLKVYPQNFKTIASKATICQ